MKDLYDSMIRTYVPILVAFIVNILGTNGIVIPEDASAGLTAFLSALAAGLFYLIARLLETHANPKFGWLLGLAKQPEYVKADGTGKRVL